MFLIKKKIDEPVTIGDSIPIDVGIAEIVNKTPALVPTHIISLHANSDVTRKQAALCCRMMSSQFDSILLTCGAKLTSLRSS